MLCKISKIFPVEGRSERMQCGPKFPLPSAGPCVSNRGRTWTRSLSNRDETMAIVFTQSHKKTDCRRMTLATCVRRDATAGPSVRSPVRTVDDEAYELRLHYLPGKVIATRNSDRPFSTWNSTFTTNYYYKYDLKSLKFKVPWRHTRSRSVTFHRGMEIKNPRPNPCRTYVAPVSNLYSKTFAATFLAKFPRRSHRWRD